MSFSRRDLHILAASMTLILVGTYAVGLFFAFLGVVSGITPLPIWMYFSYPAPLIAFVPATVAAVATYRAGSIEQSSAQWRRALGLALMGWLVAIGVLIVYQKTRGA